MKKSTTETFLAFMRLSLLISSMIMVSTGLLLAAPGAAQKLKETRLSISFSNESLDSCINRISRQTAIGFAYNPDELKLIRIPEMQFRKTGVDKILRRLFSGTGLLFSEIDNHIVVYRRPAEPAGTNAVEPLPEKEHTSTNSAMEAAKVNELHFTEVPAAITVSGTVTDSTGKPLAGVTVMIKGTRRGTVTDERGYFSLQAPGPVTLVVSFLDYESVELSVAETTLNIVLHQRSSRLEDVVVIGYSTQRRRDVTGAISSVQGDEIRNLPVTSVEDALQGRMAGVQVIQPSGEPGATANIFIRGISSINNPNPLYIVDGIRSSGDNVNIQDIESINVLKDASASAIYGAAAAGGVIIITTKKGKLGKPAIHLDARYGVTKPQLLQLLRRDDFIKYKRGLSSGYLSGVNIDSLPDTNWEDALYGNGTDENYNLSVSGASDRSNYYVSGFYNAQKGVYIDNRSYLGGFRINSDYKISKGIKVGEQLFINTRTTNPNNANPAPNPPFRTVPIMAVYDPTNVAGGGWGKTPVGFQGGNPVAQELSFFEQNKGFNFLANAFAEVKLPFYLTFRTNFSLSGGFGTQNKFQETYDVGAVKTASNSLEKSSGYSNTFLNNYTLSFDHSFGRHTINALIGYEQIINKTDAIDVSESDQALQPNYSFLPTSTSAISVPRGSSNYDPNGLIKSLFGQVFYNYDSRYYLTGAMRRDGDFTHFGPGNQYGVFPSASAAWRISNEKFFEAAHSFISDLKLRASYGVLGNSNISSYLFLSTYDLVGTAQNFSPNGTPYLSVGQVRLPNKNIKWETLYETNIGLDVTLLKNHLNATFDWYNKDTKDVLYQVPLPISAGVSEKYIANLGTINNKGLEIGLFYNNNIGKLGYSIGATGAFNKNKVLKLDGINDNPLYDGGTDIGGGYGIMTGYGPSVTQVGQPFAQFYGYKVDGIYKNDQDVAGHPQFAGQPAQVGDLKYADIDHNDTLTADDRTVIGNPNPKLVYGITIALNYRGFDLSLLFNGVAGVQLFNAVKAYAEAGYGDGNATSKVFGASYFGSNQLTSQPRIDDGYNYTRPSSYFVENAGYIKLKNLQLGYTLSPRILQNISITSAHVFVMASNLFTITKYSGIDPELFGSITSHGIDNANQYPHTRVLSAGVNFNF